MYGTCLKIQTRSRDFCLTNPGGRSCIIALDMY